MKKAAIYTRSGDLGMTSLVSGTKVKKNQERIALYGEVDELNSYIGVGISLLDKSFDKKFLITIQSSLFDLGSNLACEENKRAKFHLPQITDALVLAIEHDIDQMDVELPELQHFILPGGTQAAAMFQVCRTVCRRLERSMVAFQEKLPAEIHETDLKFINRLSDYFFILARFINLKASVQESEWIAKKN